uniref:non-specific serine/threonine protein kinase n=1 Tax=Albugo laibachii Nc14 TaxID=890382 RepID=F0VZE9_9STRA|nr:serine/threonine protein kinase putative [Albugo laibachii Nc14]|eukprot:CCA14179.1 serine/threonine protein kinase putative [Albugo laibachii Nc14]
MDPVLSGSLCFLVLSILMYVKFIREHPPWREEEEFRTARGRKSNTVASESISFLDPVTMKTPMKSPGSPSENEDHDSHYLQRKARPSDKDDDTLNEHRFPGLQHLRQLKQGKNTPFASPYTPLKQPMRRRLQSNTMNKSNRVEDKESRMLMESNDCSSDRINAESSYETSIKVASSGKGNASDSFPSHGDGIEFDEEMGYNLSDLHAPDEAPCRENTYDGKSEADYPFVPPCRGKAYDGSLDADFPFAPPFNIGHDIIRQDPAGMHEVEVKKQQTQSKIPPERPFQKVIVPPPAQMQLEVARKARIPLFLHSPMYVRSSAPPVDEHKVERHNEKHQNGAMKARKQDKVPPACQRNSLHIDFRELSVGEMIGQGAFGTVHRATWRGTTVAVKVLVCQHLTADILEEFETEVELMSILRHPNICLLMGACLKPPTRCLVIEYLPKGSLWNVLREEVGIDYSRQVSIARDVALGMNYLHSFQPPILHRDLKSPNLLVDGSYTIKISDFGLARVRAHFQTMTGNCGTTQWMAPEILAAEKYTEKADVFSYAIVCWEIMTGSCPYEGLCQIQAALGVLNNNLRPSIPPHCPPLFEQLMISCWNSIPEKRPTFEQILEVIHAQNAY